MACTVVWTCERLADLLRIQDPDIRQERDVSVDRSRLVPIIRRIYTHVSHPSGQIVSRGDTVPVQQTQAGRQRDRETERQVDRQELEILIG